MSYDRLELDPNLDEHGRERLKPLSPDDQRKSRFPFTADDVHKFESMIIENSRSCSMLEIISAVGGIILDLSQFVMSADAECALHLAEKATMEM
jgi:acetylornithine/succinyldiaminopimelate/putrescine aminotransferase